MPKYNYDDYIKLMRPIPNNFTMDKYGIPYIKKYDIDISNVNNGKWLINIENTNKSDKNAKVKIVHNFKFDDNLNRLYNNPIKYLERVSNYYATSTMDFSMHPNMSKSQIIDATFKNRWSGIWLQQNGYNNVIVTVGWVLEDTYDICFSGIVDGNVLMISTIGCNNEESYQIFINGYKELRKRFPSSKLICVGTRLDGMDDDICYVSYVQSFGNFDKYRSYWQPRLFNWDGTGGDF